MSQFAENDLAHIKDSEALLATIEKIKKSINDLGCKAEAPDYGIYYIKNDDLIFNVRVSISLPVRESFRQ